MAKHRRNLIFAWLSDFETMNITDSHPRIREFEFVYQEIIIMTQGSGTPPYDIKLIEDRSTVPISFRRNFRVAKSGK